MEIKSSKTITVSEVKEILEKRKEDGELGYEQTQALEHAEKFYKDSKTVRQIIATLTKNEKINEEVAAKIVDVWPKDPATLKAILIKDKIELSEEEIDQIIKELS
ncbi:RNA polymerase Rpb4 family protein [Candidatus Micrarchaeota archaeon]|nr:RNA polymerase Rpb4 family protein [Candidatus Micrarchaeota archaeon]